MGVSLPTVGSWRGRYAGGGLDALGDLPRTGRPVVHDQSAVVAATLVALQAVGIAGGNALVGTAAGPAPGYQLRERGPDLAAVGPMFHWTESKIRVHVFYCVLALTVAQCDAVIAESAMFGAAEVIDRLPASGDSPRH